MARTFGRFDSLGARLRTRRLERERARTLNMFAPVFQQAAQRVSQEADEAEREMSDLDRRLRATAAAPRPLVQGQRRPVGSEVPPDILPRRFSEPPPASPAGAAVFAGVPSRPGGRDVPEFGPYVALPGKREPILSYVPKLGMAAARVGSRFIEEARRIEEPLAERLSRSFLRGVGPPGTELPPQVQERLRGPVMEAFRPSNLVPLPVVDPLVARLLGIAGRGAARVAPEALRRLVRQAGVFLARPGLKPAERTAFERFVREAEQPLGGRAAGALMPDETARAQARLDEAPFPGRATRVEPPAEAAVGQLPPAEAGARLEAPVGRPAAEAEVPRGFEAEAAGAPPVGRGAAIEPSVQTSRSEAAPAPPDLAGGAPLTRAEVLARGAPAEPLVTEAVVSKPGRHAREVWRLYEGQKNTANLSRANAQNALYAEANRTGVPIVRGASIERANDDMVGIMEGALQFERGVLGRARTEAFPLEQQLLIRDLYQRVDDATARLIAGDPEFEPHKLEDYFPRLFKVTKRAGVGPRGFQTRPGFARRRDLEGPLGDILRDRPDLDLVTWDPIEMAMRHEAQVENYLASLDAIRTLKARGLILTKRGAPASWRTPNVSPFRVRQQLQGWVAEPEVARELERMFSESAFDQFGALKVVRDARDIAFRIKVFGGAFQQIDLTARAGGLGFSELARGHPLQAGRAWFSPVRAVARSLSPALDRATLRAAEHNPRMAGLYRNGLNTDVDPGFGDRVISGLGQFVPQTVAGRQIPGARGARDLLEFMSGGMYRTFHRELVEQAGLVNLEKQLRAGLPMEEASRRAVEETNVYMSSIPAWQSAVKSATGRDVARLGAFALGEFEAWFRLPVQAPAGFAGLVGMTVIAAELLNKQFTGEWLSVDQLTPYKIDERELARIRKEGARALLRTGIPAGYNTNFLRPELPWKGPNGRKLYLDLLGQADTPFRWALDPLFAAQTRLGQLPRAALDIQAAIRGEAPAFGELVETPADVARFAAQQVAPIPITGLAGTERGRIGLTGAGIQAGGVNVTAEPLREALARQFEQIKNRPFNPEVDYEEARQMPGLQPIFEQIRRAGLAVGGEGAVRREERALVTREEAERRFPPQLLDAVRRGDQQAGEGFRRGYADWQGFAAGAARQSFAGQQFDDPSSEAGKLYSRLQETTPDQFADERGAVDWSAWESVRDRLIDRIEVLQPGFTAAYERKLRLPEEMQDIEAKLKQAKRLLDGAPPRYRGLSEEQLSELQDFRARARAFRERVLAGDEPGVRTAREVPVRSFYAYGARTWANDYTLSSEDLYAASIILDSEKKRNERRNPDWLNFLADHFEQLFVFYPSLYSLDLLDAIGRRRREVSPVR